MDFKMMGWCGGMFGMVHLLWWVLLVIAIVLLARWLSGSSNKTKLEARHEDDRALGILRERYARGEIDKAEFDTRKRDLFG